MKVIALSEKRPQARTLTAAIIYDDFDFAARVAAGLDRVAIRADEAIRWDIKPWRWDLLGVASLAEAAFDETANANLLVVAASETRRLPEALMAWLDHWAMHRKIRDAAVLAFGPDDNAGAMSPAGQLKPFAEWHSLIFLDSRIWREDGEEADFINQLGQRSQPPQPVVASARFFAEAPRPPRHWGINE
jgi:hypothetical protein